MKVVKFKQLTETISVVSGTLKIPLEGGKVYASHGNPFTPKSDQFQISPATSHSVKNLAFHTMYR